MQINTRFILLVTTLLLSAVSLNAFASPRILQWHTAKGTPVYFVESKQLPIVDIRIIFDAGSARDDSQAGLAVLTNALLAEGAAEKSAQQIAEQFEDVGAQFGNGALRDMAWLSLRSLRDDRYLRPALLTLKDLLSKPTFSEESFQRELANLKVARQAAKQSPETLASEAFYKALYGDHPYASPVNGDDESLISMQRKQVLNFYDRYYVSSNAVIAIVGQLTRAQAENMADDLVSELKKGIKIPPLPPVKNLSEAQTIKIDFPSQQTHIMMGQPGTQRGDKDYFSLYVANHPFGGSGFSSRLVDEIREKRGLAYSVHSYFSPSRELGPFLIGMQTKNEQAQQALGLLTSELQKFWQKGPTEDELESTVKNITGGFPLRIDSNKKIVEYLSMIGFYHLPLDYLHNFNRQIEAVTLEQIKSALQRRLNPEKMITVIVGASTESKASSQNR
ncbi:MAG: insulinase family protein [Gammaproteobacteria bacterium]|nr:insulinase family protein [Gammaproteobacteria bacterium]